MRDAIHVGEAKPGRSSTLAYVMPAISARQFANTRRLVSIIPVVVLVATVGRASAGVPRRTMRPYLTIAYE